MNKNGHRIFSIIIFLLLTINLTGCRTENNSTENNTSKDTINENIVSEDTVSENVVSENLVTSDTVSENTVPEIMATDSICYDEYIHKKWIVDEYSEESSRFKFVITKIQKEMIEGKVSVYSRAEFNNEYYYDEEKKFSGVIENGTAKCQFEDKNGINRIMELTFINENRMKGTLRYSYEESQREENYEGEGVCFFRPYNLRDYVEALDFGSGLEYEIFAENISIYNGKGLDLWGEINIVAGIMNSLHPYPVVFLTNEQGDILYELDVSYINGVDVLDIFIEDFNGDGLNDFKIITGLSDLEKPRFTWIFYQNENGLFYKDELETKEMLRGQRE